MKTNGNPFHPQFGKRPDKFVGRDQIIQEFVDSLQNTNDPHRTTIVTGIRGSGKTALLSGVKESIDSKQSVVVDVTAGSQLLPSILDQLQLLNKQPKRKLTGVSVGALGFSLGIDTDVASGNHGFRYYLTLLVEHFNKCGLSVVFLIDEVHKADQEMRELVTSYQHLIRDNADVALLMAGLPSSIYAVLNDKVLTFLHRAHKQVLPNINVLIVENLYKNTFADANIKAQDQIWRQAAQATAGFPYLIQLMGYWLWKEAGSKLTDSDVTNALVNSKAALFDNVYELILRELSQKDHEFLLAMSEDLHDTQFGDLLVRLNVTSGYASQYRKRLIDSCLIKPTAFGSVEYAQPYLKEFLLHKTHA
jgi:hypothetical protein